MPHPAAALEAQMRQIRARIEGQAFPNLWVADLIALAGLEAELARIYQAQRSAAK